MRRVYWSKDFNTVALCSSSQIMICDKTLRLLSQSKESSKFKSGCFDENGAFVYSTSSHVKYLYTSSNTHGVFCSTEHPVYVTDFRSGRLTFITRSGKVETQAVKMADYTFKISLKQGKIKNLKTGQLVGRQIVEFLKEENCADIALMFEKNKKVRFDLCVAAGDIQKAYETAVEINERETYLKLAQQAMNQGYQNVAEKSY